MTDIAFILSGFFVGFVVGLTGVGGGSLMTPLLIFGFGIKPILAVGTDLLFAAFTKLGGTVNLTLARRIDWKIVGTLSLGSIPAALLTVGALHYVGAANEAMQKVVTSTLGGGVPWASAMPGRTASRTGMICLMAGSPPSAL